MLTSCPIFHGPGARQAALDEANRQGRLLCPPFGEEKVMGLTVDEARDFVSLLQSPPIGEQVGVVIAGPMDKASPKASDTLLKTIESFNPYVLPILWATDLGGVRGTIRSRCMGTWCPATGFEPVDEELEDTARDLLNASLRGNYWQVPLLVAKAGPNKKAKLPARYGELLTETIDMMVSMLAADQRVLPLWERVREVARWRNPTPMEVISAFLPAP